MNKEKVTYEVSVNTSGLTFWWYLKVGGTLSLLGATWGLLQMVAGAK